MVRAKVSPSVIFSLSSLPTSCFGSWKPYSKRAALLSMAATSTTSMLLTRAKKNFSHSFQRYA